MNQAVPTSCVVETPFALADGIVGAVWRDGAKWLDPCVGGGVFVRSIQGRCPSAEIVCCDISPQDVKGTKFVEGDFLGALDRFGLFDVIVANPPYVPVSRLSRTLQQNALAETGFDLTVSGGASYWLPFLIRCLKCLAKGGNLALILPAAYEYGDYCRAVREGVPKLFERFEVHRSLRPMFPTVSDGCVVVLGFGYGGTHRSEVRYEHADSNELLGHLTGGSEGSTSRGGISHEETAKTLGSVVELGIGAVTGDASFFLMSEKQREARGIAPEDCITVFTRSRQVSRAVLVGLDHWDPDDRRLLFKPRELAAMSPGSMKFMADGEQGACRRSGHKVRLREPWWAVPIPERIDGVVTGMFSSIPWIAPVPKGVSCTNTLYWYRFRKPMSAARRRAFMLSIYTSRFHAAVLASARRYPDGLLKLEPGQFKRLPLVLLDESRVTGPLLVRAASLLRNGELQRCRELADSCIREGG